MNGEDDMGDVVLDEDVVAIDGYVVGRGSDVVDFLFHRRIFFPDSGGNSSGGGRNLFYVRKIAECCKIRRIPLIYARFVLYLQKKETFI